MSDEVRIPAHKKELIYKLYSLFQKIEEYEYKKTPTSIFVDSGSMSPYIYWSGWAPVSFPNRPGLAVVTSPSYYPKRYTKILRVINMFQSLMDSLDIYNAYISSYEELSDEIDDLLGMDIEEFILYLKMI